MIDAPESANEKRHAAVSFRDIFPTEKEWPVLDYPLTTKDRLRGIGVETARMSYPGGMCRGRRPVVRKGTKLKLEQLFSSEQFLLFDLTRPSLAADLYVDWHRATTEMIAGELVAANCLANRENDGEAVTAKFLDTFMHQLMKYAEFRPLFDQMHLPLDRRVLGRLRSLKSSAAAHKVGRRVRGRSLYSISYDDYRFVQDTLSELVAELNGRNAMEFEITSRIKLNLLWL